MWVCLGVAINLLSVSQIKERAHRHISKRDRMSEMLWMSASVLVGVCLYASVRLHGHMKIDLRYNNNGFNKAPCVASPPLILPR